MKYYRIGFDKRELSEIITAFNKKNPPFKEYEQFIKYLTLTCIDLKQENNRLKAIIRILKGEL